MDNNKVNVWVTTWGKYNGARLEGDWVCLSDFDTLEDFYEACRQMHEDDHDPEFLFADCENMPRGLYSENTVSEEAFEWAKDFAEADNDTQCAMWAFVDCFGEWDKQKFEDSYIGEFDSDEDEAMHYIEETGGVEELPQTTKQTYFDYEAFGRDLRLGGDIDAYNDDYESDGSEWDYLSDREVGEKWAEDIGINDEDYNRYFDFEMFGRDCRLSGDITSQDGYYFYQY